MQNSITLLSNVDVDNIVRSCIDLYNSLPKTGKPVEKEWTVLSCVIQYDNSSGNHEIVSLGTGSKCIGATKMSSLGDNLNDSHAEVFARRGFLLYLYDNIEKCLESKSSIFIKEEHKLTVKDYIQFIFYSSQLPCGDACIIPKVDDTEEYGDVLQTKKHLADDDICSTDEKKAKTIDDTHRTGAKCLLGSTQDLKEPGLNYHLPGQVRTKPGRGDRTLSVSCSDKMARWVYLGLQGALLDMLCEKILITHFIFGSGVPYSKETLHRALVQRDCMCAQELIPRVPEFYKSTVTFPFIKTKYNTRPAPGSIVWHRTEKPTVEVAIQGRRLGLTKKKACSPNSYISISKYKLYERFLTIMSKHKEFKEGIFGANSIKNMPYHELKRKSISYHQRWQEVKQKFFKNWTVKPDMWNFYANIN